MKRIVFVVIITMLICLPSGVYGQKDANDDPVIRIFKRYEEKEGVESITISPTLFGMMNGKTNDKKTQDLISKITGLRILTLTDDADGKGRANREAITRELKAVVQKDYEEIMKVKSSDDRLELYVRNKPTNCKDCQGALLFITSATNSVTVIYLSGTIDKSLIDAVMNGEIGITNKSLNL